MCCARFITLVCLASLLSSCALPWNRAEVAPPIPPFPTPSSSEEKIVRKTIIVRGTYDGENRLHVPSGLGDGSQSEKQRPLFRLVSTGATLKNVHLKGADGIHIEAPDCRILNCVNHDVGEDAITIEKPGTLVKDCWFKRATDKVIQVNSGSVKVEHCVAVNFGCFVRLNGDSKHPIRALVSDCRLWKGTSGIRAHGSGSDARAKRNEFYQVSRPFDILEGARLSESDNTSIP
jgi:pectate lyase C